jgi:hypothetical protein
MATTRRPNVISHAAAGDASTGRLLVKKLVWNGSTNAGDDLEIKNSAGTVLLKLKAGTNVGHLQLDYPFGDVMINGIETDVIDAGTVEYILG